MRGFSKAIIAGNLTRDPELRNTTTGRTVCSFSVAVSRRFKGSDGQDREETSFIGCSAWGPMGENIAKYLKKGDPILVSGRLQQRSWDDQKTGEKRSIVDINVEDFVFLPRGNGGSNGGSYSSGQNYTGGYTPNNNRSSDNSQEVVPDDVPEGPLDINDIPF